MNGIEIPGLGFPDTFAVKKEVERVSFWLGCKSVTKKHFINQSNFQKSYKLVLDFQDGAISIIESRNLVKELHKEIQDISGEDLWGEACELIFNI